MLSFFQVIYALNTKKDEHESQVQHLQQQHEQEVERLAANTKQKLLLCEQRLAESESHMERIAELEQAVFEHQSQQQQILQQHTDYKHSMQEKLHQQEINFSQKIWEFSGELLEMKKDFQEKLQNFELTKVQVSFYFICFLCTEKVSKEEFFLIALLNVWDEKTNRSLTHLIAALFH